LRSVSVPVAGVDVITAYYTASSAAQQPVADRYAP
jgi:hypothetical protein